MCLLSSKSGCKAIQASLVTMEDSVRGSAAKLKVKAIGVQ
jgi:hypothetical protein